MDPRPLPMLERPAPLQRTAVPRPTPGKAIPHRPILAVSSNRLTKLLRCLVLVVEGHPILSVPSCCAASESLYFCGFYLNRRWASRLVPRTLDAPYLDPPP